tara:strand:+ start:381 stop:560 length:180 start_codon:yes stop_codon:yes gene_type:complete
MRTLGLLLIFATLTACGADGEPVVPTAQTTITGSSDGLRVAQSLEMRRGPLTVALGLGA